MKPHSNRSLLGSPSAPGAVDLWRTFQPYLVGVPGECDRADVNAIFLQPFGSCTTPTA